MQPWTPEDSVQASALSKDIAGVWKGTQAMGEGLHGCTHPHLALHKHNRERLGLLLALGHCGLLNENPKQTVQLCTPPLPEQVGEPPRVFNQLSTCMLPEQAGGGTNRCPTRGLAAAEEGKQGSEDCS